jgi:hypothetical protein
LQEFFLNRETFSSNQLHSKESKILLQKYHSTISFQHLHYPKAGHGIHIPAIPQSSNFLFHPVAKIYLLLGGSMAANWYACQNSWKKLICFFDKTLNSQSMNRE